MENIFGEVRYIKKNGKESPPFPLSHGKFTIGSDMEANIRLKAQDDCIENIHCILHVNKRGQVTLMNESKAYPTKVNGINVKTSKVLKDNDNFEVVDKIFKFSQTELGKELQSSPSSATVRSVSRRHTILLGSSVPHLVTKKSSKRASLSANPIKVSPYGKKRHSMNLSKNTSIQKKQRRVTNVMPSSSTSFNIKKLSSPDARPNTKNINLGLSTTSKINVPKSLPASGISKKRLSLCLADPNVTVSPEAKVSTRNILLGNTACDVQVPSRRSNMSLTVSSTPILKSAKKTPKSVKRLQKTPLSAFKSSFSVTPTRSSSRTRQTPRKYEDFALQYSFISEASAKSNASKGNQSQNLDESDLGGPSLKQNLDEISQSPANINLSVKKTEKSTRRSILSNITEDYLSPIVKSEARGSVNRKSKQIHDDGTNTNNKTKDDLITFEDTIEIQDTSAVHSFNIYAKTPEVSDRREISNRSLNKSNSTNVMDSSMSSRRSARKTKKTSDAGHQTIELSPVLSKSRTSRTLPASLLKNTSTNSLDNTEEVPDEAKLSISAFDVDSKQVETADNLKTSRTSRTYSRVSKLTGTSLDVIQTDNSVQDGDNFEKDISNASLAGEKRDRTRNSKANLEKESSLINCTVDCGGDASVKDLSGSSLTEKKKSSRISDTKDNSVCHADYVEKDMSNTSFASETKKKSRSDTGLGNILQHICSTLEWSDSEEDTSNISLNSNEQKSAGPSKINTNQSASSVGEKSRCSRVSAAKTDTSHDVLEQSVHAVNDDSEGDVSRTSLACDKRRSSRTSKGKTDASFDDSLQLDQSTQYDEDLEEGLIGTSTLLAGEKQRTSRVSKAKTEPSFQDLAQSVQTVNDDNDGRGDVSRISTASDKRRRSRTSKVNASFDNSIKLDQSTQCDVSPERGSILINASFGSEKRKSSRVSKAKSDTGFENSIKLDQSTQCDDVGAEEATVLSNASFGNEKRKSSRVSKGKTDISSENLAQTVQTIQFDDTVPKQASILDNALFSSEKRKSSRVSKAKNDTSFENSLKLNQSTQCDHLDPKQASILSNASFSGEKRKSSRVSRAKTDISSEDLAQTVEIIYDDDDNSKGDISRISTASDKRNRSRTSKVNTNASSKSSILKLDQSTQSDVSPEQGSVLINASLSSDTRKSSRVSKDQSIKQGSILTNNSLISEKRRSSRGSVQADTSFEDLVQSVHSVQEGDDSKSEISRISLVSDKWRNSRTSEAGLEKSIQIDHSAQYDEDSEQGSLISGKRRRSRISKVKTDTSLQNLTQTDQFTQYEDDFEGISNSSSLMSVSEDKRNDLPEANTTSDLSSNEKRNISTRFMKSYNTSSKIQLERPDSLVVNLDSDSNVSTCSSVGDKSAFSVTSTPYDKMSGVTLRNNRKVVTNQLRATTETVTTPENNISLIEISSRENTPVSKVRKYSSTFKNNSTKMEETTPEHRSADDGNFKTPLTTPALFESLKKSALRSRNRISLTKKSLVIAESEFDAEEKETAEEKPIARGVKRMRESTGTIKTAKKKKVSGSQDCGVPKLLRFPSSDLESENSIVDSDMEEISGDSTNENSEHFTESYNTSTGSGTLDISNLKDKSKTGSMKNESFTESNPLRRSQRSLSLQANSTFDNTLAQSVSSRMSPKTQSEIDLATETVVANVNTVQQRKSNVTDSDLVEHEDTSIQKRNSVRTYSKKFRTSNQDTNDASVHSSSGARTPKQSTVNVTTNLSGIKRILRTPKSPVNDLRDVRGVRNLLQTPKEQQSPNISYIGGIFQTPLLKNSQNSSTISDVKSSSKKAPERLVKTTRPQRGPKNDLTDVVGVKQLLRTPKTQNSPKNDLTNVAGVKKLYRTPTNQKTPKNDLSDVGGVKKMFNTPRNDKEPKNDLTDVFGLKKLYGTPKQVESPKNDLSDVSGVKRMYQLEHVAANRKSLNVSGVNELFQAGENESDIENADLFTKLTHRKALRTYKGKSLSPMKGLSPLSTVNSRRTLGDIPTNSPNVDKWVEEQLNYVTKEQQIDVTQISETAEVNDNEIYSSASLKTSEETLKETPVKTLRNRKNTKDMIPAKVDEEEESVIPKRTLRDRKANKKTDDTEETTAVDVPNGRAKRNARKHTTDSQEMAPVPVPIKRTRNAKKSAVDNNSLTVEVSTSVATTEPEETSKTQKRKLLNDNDVNNSLSEVSETIAELPKTRPKRTRKNKKEESLNEIGNNDEVEESKPRGRSVRQKRAVKDLHDSVSSEVQDDGKIIGTAVDDLPKTRPKRAAAKTAGTRELTRSRKAAKVNADESLDQKVDTEVEKLKVSEVTENINTDIAEIAELPKTRAKRNPKISSDTPEIVPLKKSKRIVKKVKFEGVNDIKDTEKDTLVPATELKSQKRSLRTKNESTSKVSADTDNVDVENETLAKGSEVHEKENIPQKSSKRNQRTKKAQNVDEKEEDPVSELSEDSKPNSRRNLRNTKSNKTGNELDVELKPTKTGGRKKQEVKPESPVKSKARSKKSKIAAPVESEVNDTPIEDVADEAREPKGTGRSKRAKTEQVNTNQLQFVIDDDGVEIQTLPKSRRRKLFNAADMDCVIDIGVGGAGPSQRQLRRRR